MVELNIESIGADWCIDDIIKVALDENGSFNTDIVPIPQNKLPHLKGTLTINNTTVDLSEAYSFNRITKDSSSREISSNSETYYDCYFESNELPSILIRLDSSFKPAYAVINSDSGSGGTVIK